MQCFLLHLIEKQINNHGGIAMPLVYAPYCSRCGTTHTTHPSGLCSHCRRRPKPRVPCRVCGTPTNHDSGLCHKCRRGAPLHDKLGSAVEKYKLILSVLEFRQQGCSFSEIAEIVGMSKSAVYELYRDSLHLPEWAGPLE